MSARPTAPVTVTRILQRGQFARGLAFVKRAEASVSREPLCKTRRARAADVVAIYGLIAHYAGQGLLLPRSEEEVRAALDHFLVLEEGGRVIGCVALEPYSADLAEVRSLAIAPESNGRGLGGRLVRFALAMAKRRRIARVFAVTHAPEFFLQLGFESTTRQAVPEKVERDCRACPKQQSCYLVAVFFTVLRDPVVLPVLPSAVEPLPAR